MKKRESRVLNYLASIGVTLVAVGLRYLMDPVMHDNLPFVTLFGAVAFSMWLGGYGAAAASIFIGFFLCNYLFIEPRGHLFLGTQQTFLGLIAYLFTCGILAGFVGAMRKAQYAAKDREETLRVTLDSIGDAVIATDDKGIITYLNGIARTMTGWRHSDAIGRPLEHVFRIRDENTKTSIEKLAQRTLNDSRVIVLARGTLLAAANDAEVAIDGSAAPIKDLQGTSYGCVIVFRDIAEKRNIENALAHLASVVESSDDAIITKTLDGNITSWNAAAQRIFGYTPGEAIGKPITMIIPPDRLDEEKDIVDQLRRGLRIDHYETVRVAKNGTLLDISLTVSPLRDSTGAIIGASKVARDITQRKRVETAIRQHREWLQVTLTSIGDGVITTDDQSKITFLNPVAEALTEWKLADAEGRRIQEVLTIVNEDTGAAVENPAEIALKEGRVVGLANHSILVSRNGTRIPIDDSGAPIKDADGRIIGAVLIFRNISERRKTEALIREQAAEREQLLEREQAARANAESANRMKDEFLATVSHELRTPLNAIVGWTRLLSTEKLDADATRKAIDTIDQSAKAQARLIEDLLDVSRIISGKLRLEFAPVELEPTIRTALDIVRPTAASKSIQLIAELDRSGLSVLGDAARVQQIVWNLLSNAIKFTPRGGQVHLRLETFKSDAQIVVSDTGRGIKREFLPHLFERFRQADAGTTRQHGGLGLGLAIVRHLVEIHGGSVSAASEGEGKGAQFTVRLPLIAVKARKDQQKDSLPQTMPLLTGIKALVVDDDASARDVISAILTRCGAHVSTVGSAAEALKAVPIFLPDVVVSDIAMPDENGLDLIIKVRRLKPEEGGNTPAVALTAYATTEDRLRALAAGFQTHVSKPVEPAELMMVVASVIAANKPRH